MMMRIKPELVVGGGTQEIGRATDRVMHEWRLPLIACIQEDRS
jgi:hypothetical protein